MCIERGNLHSQRIGLASQSCIVVLQLAQIRVAVRRIARISIRVEAGRIDDRLETLDGFLELNNK